MKFILIFFYLIAVLTNLSTAQIKSNAGNVVITFNNDETHIQLNKTGELKINVSLKDSLRFKTNGLISYSDFGARGDGKTDDMMQSLLLMHLPISTDFL